MLFYVYVELPTYIRQYVGTYQDACNTYISESINLSNFFQFFNQYFNNYNTIICYCIFSALPDQKPDHGRRLASDVRKPLPEADRVDQLHSAGMNFKNLRFGQKLFVQMFTLIFLTNFNPNKLLEYCGLSS
jgi:hypothetical protein